MITYRIILRFIVARDKYLISQNYELGVSRFRHVIEEHYLVSFKILETQLRQSI